MTKKEFMDLTFDNFNVHDKEVHTYLSGNIEKGDYDALERLINKEEPPYPEDGSMEKREPKYLDEEVEEIKSLLDKVPAEIKFHYFRHFFLEDQVRDFIDGHESLEEIADLREMKVQGLND